MTVVALACAALMFSCGGKALEGTKVTKGNKMKFDTLSYALGANMGGGIKQQFRDINFNIDVVNDAIEDVLKGKANEDHEASLEILREFFGETLNNRYRTYQENLKADSTAVFQAFADDAECKTISYAFGNDIGANILRSQVPIQYYWMLKGFNEAWNDEAQLAQDEIMVFLNRYFTQVLPAENAERSAKWLEAKAQEEGVQKTESGLLYKVIEQGDMVQAAQKDEDKVKVHYVGKLQDGTVFDASRFENRSEDQQKMIRKQQPSLFDENGNILKDEPIEFPLNRVIKGWTEGMKLIGPGGKIMLYIPAELAYGRQGAGGMIGPNEALEFEVELIEVTPTKVEVEAPAATGKAGKVVTKSSKKGAKK